MRRLAEQRSKPVGLTVGFLWTACVHAGGAVLLMAAARPQPLPPPVYAVELVAAPRVASQRRRPPEATPRPVEQPKAAPPKPQTERAPDPDPVPEHVVPAEPAPETAPSEQALPDETPSTGTAPASVETPGLVFKYPQYLENIVAQVYRRWDRPRTNARLKAEIFFIILRDGTIREIRFITRSGNFTFDLGAQGAIEAAANAGAFGRLPDGFEEDVLPVSFFFTPRRDS